MASIRVLPTKGTLFMDFRVGGRRYREYTALPDTPANRRRLQKVLDRIEAEIAAGTFDYERIFGRPAPAASTASKELLPPVPASELVPAAAPAAPAAAASATPRFADFAEQWFAEASVAWRRSYVVTQRGVLDRYLLPHFGDRAVGSITKADVLAFRATLAKVPARGRQGTLSHRRINAIMKPLRQILNEAADRFEFTSAFRNIKPLKIKRSDVMPFTLEEVQRILRAVRPDWRNYFVVRFFTGMRTGEVHGLKWHHVDFERRLILVRESFVLGEDDELKTDGSMRDIQMNQVVYEALAAQRRASREDALYVFANRAGRPIDNKNFMTRVWYPLLRHLDLAPRRPYQMRHTAATLWLAAGESPEWIARQLGHSSTEMLFRIYSRFVPNLTRRDGSAFERLLCQHLGPVGVVGAGAAAVATDVDHGAWEGSHERV